VVQLYSLVFARETHAPHLTALLDGPHRMVTSRADFVAAMAKRLPDVAYVDFDLLPQIENDRACVPVVAIIEGGRDVVIRALQAFPWLAHVVNAASLTQPVAQREITQLHERLERGEEPCLLTQDGVGRVALLTSSARREARLERVREFFESHSIWDKATTALADIAEELLTNALYDAPVEAGYFRESVPRTSDVELPPEHACEISYGIEGDLAFVRVRDPFGALTRSRLLAVLDRCNRTDVALDESRGGAGLGLWRVFSLASSIAISVIPRRLTDIHVCVEAKKSRTAGKHLHTVQLCFPDEVPLDGALGRFAADHDYDLMDDSFTALIA
jgi:hypothetical protein